jgi:hypothetical protein
MRLRRRASEIDPLWQELHDVEYRVRRIEDEELAEEAEARGAVKETQRRLSRRHKLLVTVSGGVAFISTVITILTKLHVL